MSGAGNQNRTETPMQSLLQDALLQIRTLKRRLEESQRLEPIAIVGAGLRFPGQVHDLESFWTALEAGRDAVTTVPPDRWDVDALYDPDPAAAGKIYARFGSFLEGVDRFDPDFFGISRVEAAAMDPQQRLMLEVTWEALEHAGIAPKSVSGSQTGVFVGVMYNDYAMRQLRETGLEGIGPYAGTGTAFSALAGRLAYILGTHGPTHAVDAACASSLISVHLACQALRGGECDTALAGGVNVILSPEPSINLSRARMLSPSGRCRTFDASADGYVRGEGCGMVVLKRLSRAQADGDRILGLIRGSAVNQDGRSSGLTAPNGEAQQALFRETLRLTGLRPSEIGYLECHGTGTPLGDPIEVSSVVEVFGRGRSADRPLAIGSVKTNYGHLESAAGICGLIRTMLILSHKTIPPHLHFRELNPHISFFGAPITIPTRSTPWFEPYECPRAGVSAFSFIGTNCNVILEAPPEPQKLEPTRYQSRAGQLFTLSARRIDALRTLAGRYAGMLEQTPDLTLEQLCTSVRTTRDHFEERLAIPVQDVETLRQALETFQAGGTPVGASIGRAPRQQRRIAMLFTGQGAQRAGMGRGLYRLEPVFREVVDRCDAFLRPLLGHSVRTLLLEADDATLAETRFTQPALFVLEYALYSLWRAWGIEPVALVGHSVGEIVAACAAGVFSLEDALRLVTARGALMQALPAGGAMAAVFAAEDAVLPYIADLVRSLSIAAVNGPEEVVLSGAENTLEIALRRLSGAGMGARRLQVSHAFHSPLMRPMLEPFARVLETLTLHAPQGVVISNLTGEEAGPRLAQKEYWLEHVMAPVRFAQSIQTLRGLGCDVFVEAGPRPVLLGLLGETAGRDSEVRITSLKPGVEESAHLNACRAQLYVAGVGLDWKALDGEMPRHFDLPLTPFQQERCWFELVQKTETPGNERAAREARASEARVREARVRGMGSTRPLRRRDEVSSDLQLSLMFFAATKESLEDSSYQMVIDAARYADDHGFRSVWVPERHFSPMGSIYPNPAVLHAALARETQHIRLMAGSTVVPLHHPVRLIEDWSMVDNLSGGRVGIACAPGWNPDDFVLAPGRYPERHDYLFKTVPELRRMWRDQSYEGLSGTGDHVRLRMYPPPVQPELPLWITSANNVRNFERAGSLGANLLTHLLDQEIDELAEKIRIYRQARAAAGYDPETGIVSVMVHTFVESTMERALQRARKPFCDYLKTNLPLFAGLAKSRNRTVDLSALSPSEIDDFVQFLFERFHSRRALIGTPESCRPVLEQLQGAGVQEVACLLDFGPSSSQVLDALPNLADLGRSVGGLVASREEPLELSGPVEVSRAQLRENERTQTETIDAPTLDPLDDWLYVPTWQQKPLEEHLIPRKPQGTWVVFADRDGVAARLAERLETEGATSHLIYAGATTRLDSDGRATLNPRDPSGIADLLTGLRVRRDDLQGVVFLWGLDALPVGGDAEGEAGEIDAAALSGTVLQLVQTLLLHTQASSARLWLVTRGAQRVLETDASFTPAAGTLWGMGRSLLLEHPTEFGALVDLEPGEPVEPAAGTLFRLLSHSDRERELAFRRGRRYVSRLTRAPRRTATSPAQPSPRRHRTDGTWLITGGLGGMGLEVAADAVTRGIPDLLLIGRTVLPDEETWAQLPADHPAQPSIRALMALRARGSNVRYCAVDVTDGPALRRVLREHAEHVGRPLRGVFHCAGHWQDRAMAHMSLESLESVLRPKVDGAWNLHTCTLQADLDAFVLFSSLSALLPAHGQANYAAANAFLDALAWHRRSLGLPAQSINWGPWSEVGFAATSFGTIAHQRLESFGIRRFSPPVGLAVLERLMADDVPQIAAVDLDWRRLADVDPTLAKSPFLAELSVLANPDQTASTLSEEARTFLQSLWATPAAERVELMLERLRGVMETTLRLPPGMMAPTRPLVELGVDSLMAVEIKNRVQNTLGTTFSMVEVLRGASLTELAHLMVARHALEQTQLAGPGAEADAAEEELVL